MQAIKTRFVGPTNTKGSRVKASCDAGTVTLSWDYSVGSEGNHQKAAMALLNKIHSQSGHFDGWKGPWVGATYNGDTYWVNQTTARSECVIVGLS